MNWTRRTLLAGATAALAGPVQATTWVATPGRNGALAFPTSQAPIIDFRALAANPIRLRSIEIFEQDRNTQFVRAISEDGLEGVVKANSRMEEVISLLDFSVSPYFLGQDLRDLESILDRVHRAQYKFLGLALWTAIGHVELACWDLIGKTISKRCVDMMGAQRRDAIPIYVSSLNRHTSAEAEVAAIQEAVARTGAKAAKIKVGGRMSRNADASPGRQEALVPLLRQSMGDAFTIYCDANGSFDAPTAIRLCDLLEDYGVDNLEEPCPFQDFEMTRQVTRAVRRKRMKLKIAGGEQDGSLEMWRWYLGNGALDILQPDFMYNGGMIRTLKVARMAQAAGVPVAPHYPRNGVETVELLHFAAHVENLYKFQEYRARPRALDFGHEPVIEPKDGLLKVPSGPGFGATFDPAIWSRARRLNQVVIAKDV